MTPDQEEQLRQIELHARVLRTDFESAELAGATVPQIMDARLLLDGAVRKATEAICWVDKTRGG